MKTFCGVCVRVFKRKFAWISIILDLYLKEFTRSITHRNQSVYLFLWMRIRPSQIDAFRFASCRFNCLVDSWYVFKCNKKMYIQKIENYFFWLLCTYTRRFPTFRISRDVDSLIDCTFVTIYAFYVWIFTRKKDFRDDMEKSIRNLLLRNCVNWITYNFCSPIKKIKLFLMFFPCTVSKVMANETIKNLNK